MKSVSVKLNLGRRCSTFDEFTFCGDSKKAARSAPRDDVFNSASSSEVLSYDATQHDCVSEPATEAAADIGFPAEGAGDLTGVCGFSARVPADLSAVTAAAI